MRVLTSIAFFGFVAVVSLARTQSANVYRVHKLILKSDDLPLVERHAIIHAFQGNTYNIDELAERIRSKIRDRGYPIVEVSVDEIRHLNPASHTCIADVSYVVHAGSRYRLREITFHIRSGETAFSTDQLRAQFPLRNRSMFNAHKIGDGLNNLRELYASAGYANLGAIPRADYDDIRHTFTLDIDIDQGVPVSFGRLLMEGVEPRTGVALQLRNSWKEIEGRHYNPRILEDWLKQNEVSWPSGAAAQAHISVVSETNSIMNILLHFQ